MLVHNSSTSLEGAKCESVDSGWPVHSALSNHPTNLYPEFALAVDPLALPVAGFRLSLSGLTHPPPIAL